MNLSQTRGDTRNYFFQRKDADRNRLSAFLVAVSGDKTSIAFARATSLYGTAATNISDSYVKLIEGYKH